MHKPEWRKDCYGRVDQALYLGKLYVGSISRVAPEGWRDFAHFKDPPAKQAESIASRAEYYSKLEATPWRAWFMSDEDGNDIGWYATYDEARKALEDHLEYALALC